MPFTFLAHQAPVMPFATRGSDRVDGLALVVGTMAPDLAYVSSGWRYGPWGVPLYFDGHRWQNQLLLAVFAWVLVWVVRRVVLPVAPLAVAGAVGAPLAALGSVRHRWWVTYLCVLVGALTHVVLDELTHVDDDVARAVLQIASSVLLAAWCVVMLVRWWPTLPRPDLDLPPPHARAVVIAGLVGGVGVGLPYAIGRLGRQPYGAGTIDLGPSVAVISFCWMVFLGLVAGCVAARAMWDPRADHQPRSIHS
ncbi:MAG TPA: DUF4184 family protein [Microthrixaceae bacterium]|nr:DUF4184 family protein [Microthrixaceae bacterium]